MTSPVRLDEQGLFPAIVQDAVTGDVLMLAYMNDEALRQTRATGRAHYWSRSRNALWRKGETSGHEQLVEDIRVNCEENSLLLLVRQTGAVCHTGYPTCFYRRIEADDTLTVVRARAFDPADVYATVEHAGPADRTMLDSLAEATREQFGAYAFLRDNDLTARSGTSVRLRTVDERIQHRLADELRELAGALDGTHRHQGGPEDVSLEASQVVYWALLVALSDQITWSTLRPDRALATSVPDMSASNLATLLRHDADQWESPPSILDRAARLHATLALVGQACRCKDLDPLSIIERDLAELRGRPYLGPYFAPGNE